MLIPVFAMCVLSGNRLSAAEPPAFAPLRYDEDYRYLRDKPLPSAGDRLKFIPLNGTENLWLTLGGEIREQYEFYQNVDFGEGVQDPDGYLLQRYLLHGAFHVGPHMRFFGELQSAFASGKQPGPSPVDEDRFDWHQGFLELSTGELKLRLGRQEISLGSERLVSKREGPNLRRSFDGARILHVRDDHETTAFIARPVDTDEGVFDDESERQRLFWGIYATVPLQGFSDSSLDLYYLGLENDDASYAQGSAKETRQTFGTRWFGTTAVGPGIADYNFESAYQFGNFGQGSINAWTVASDTGITLSSWPLSPRFGLRADIASGDRNPDNTDLQTFNALFPKGDYFGESSLLGPWDFVDLQPTLGLQLTDNVSLTARWTFFWRQNVNDGLYGPSGTPVRGADPDASRYVGNEASVAVHWQINRHLTAGVAYAHFFTGNYLRQTGLSGDVNYALLTLQFKF